MYKTSPLESNGTKLQPVVGADVLRSDGVPISPSARWAFPSRALRRQHVKLYDSSQQA